MSYHGARPGVTGLAFLAAFAVVAAEMGAISTTNLPGRPRDAVIGPDAVYEHVDTWDLPAMDWIDGMLPADIALGEDEVVFIADASTHSVRRLPLTGDEPEPWYPTWGPHQGGNTPALIPYRMAVDAIRRRATISWTIWDMVGGDARVTDSWLEVRPLAGAPPRLAMGGDLATAQSDLAVDPDRGFWLHSREGVVHHSL